MLIYFKINLIEISSSAIIHVLHVLDQVELNVLYVLVKIKLYNKIIHVHVIHMDIGQIKIKYANLMLHFIIWILHNFNNGI